MDAAVYSKWEDQLTKTIDKWIVKTMEEYEWQAPNAPYVGGGTPRWMARAALSALGCAAESERAREAGE